MTPSFMGRMAVMFPGVRPSISFASLPTASPLAGPGPSLCDANRVLSTHLDTIHCLVGFLHKFLRFFAVIRVEAQPQARGKPRFESELGQKPVALERISNALRDGDRSLGVGIGGDGHALTPSAA